MHLALRWSLRLFRKPRKWLSKKLRPMSRLWHDRIVPKWHQRRINSWMYVDETGSFKGDGTSFYIGATGIIVDRRGLELLQSIKAKFVEDHLPGIDRSIEVHAVEWVHDYSDLPPEIGPADA